MILSLLLAAQIAVSPSGTTSQTQPWVAVDSQQAVVVWLETGQILFSRIRLDGTRLDDGRVVSMRGINPRIAANGMNYLIVWIEDSDVMGRFLLPNGTFTGDAFAITDVHSVDYPAVAWAGSRYVVAWSGPDAGAAEVRSGQSLDTFKIFGDDKTIVGDLSIAPAGGDDSIVAYNTQNSLTDFPITTTITTLLWQPMNSDPPVPHVIATQTTTDSNAGRMSVRTPRIAPSMTGFLLGWTLQNGPGRGSYTFVTQISGEGKQIGDPAMVGSSLGSSSFPDAIANPAGERVFTVDYPQFVEAKVDFSCGCVTKQMLATAPATAAPSFENFTATTLLAGGFALAYEYVPNSGPRVFLQFVDVPPPPVPLPPRTRPTRH